MGPPRQLERKLLGQRPALADSFCKVTKMGHVRHAFPCLPIPTLVSAWWDGGEQYQVHWTEGSLCLQPNSFCLHPALEQESLWILTFLSSTSRWAELSLVAGSWATGSSFPKKAPAFLLIKQAQAVPHIKTWIPFSLLWSLRGPYDCLPAYCGKITDLVTSKPLPSKCGDPLLLPLRTFALGVLQDSSCCVMRCPRHTEKNEAHWSVVLAELQAHRSHQHVAMWTSHWGCSSLIKPSEVRRSSQNYVHQKDHVYGGWTAQPTDSSTIIVTTALIQEWLITQMARAASGSKESGKWSFLLQNLVPWSLHNCLNLNLP